MNREVLSGRRLRVNREDFELRPDLLDDPPVRVDGGVKSRRVWRVKNITFEGIISCRGRHDVPSYGTR